MASSKSAKSKSKVKLKHSSAPRAKTKVAILGAGFIADIHMESYHRFVPDAEVVAVFTHNRIRGEAFARKHGIPAVYNDLVSAITKSGCDVVDICLPNYLHHKAVMTAAKAVKHVIIEKPLCLTLDEADEMIGACKSAGVKLMYAEELCFAPKYERVRKLVQDKAIGKIFQMRQCEKHSGPHSDWFYDIKLSGGGALMDMGCHGVAWFRWMLGGRPKVKSVYAHMQNCYHNHRTIAEDNSVCIVEFEGGAIGIAENSWAKHGGMDDRVEVYGDGGVVYADLFQGNAALTYSLHGYDYAMEKAGSTKGWTFTVFEEAFNQGYPQELRHFIHCVREDDTPLVTGDDGRAVLEILHAAYASAGQGRKIELPFLEKAARPIDLWVNARAK